jgi:tRNA (cmo5U34)-methyltransferase
MMYNKYNWRFNKDIVNIFDSHIRKSIPMYEEFQKNIADMSVYFTQKDSNIVDIGTSTGNLISKLKEINNNRNLTFNGLDIENDMIEYCIEHFKDINFKLCDALDYDYTNTSVITSMLSLQFMNKSDRIVLLEKIYNEMCVDGALFIVEKVKNDIIDLHDIYNDIYYDFKRENLSDSEILDKNMSIRGISKPLSLDDNIKMLKDAGFKKIDIFLKSMNFVGIIAIK